MAKPETTYLCPCCGYPELDVKPYENIPGSPPYDESVKPPYYLTWGKASYDVCACCGFEYGFDDNPGHEENTMSFKQYLKYWLEEESGKWFNPEKQPDNWDLVRQLQNAGMEVPDFVMAKRLLT